jgi:hypothetical protein
MTHKLHAADANHPLKAIRRFDVFAEFNRLEALDDGRPEDEAKGHGIWLAKVVASRRYGPKTDGDSRDAGKGGAGEKTPKRSAVKGFKAVGGELQTDKTFDEEIVDRMGQGFYDQVFAPAIRAAVEKGQKYEEIRDQIRADWKPKR